MSDNSTNNKNSLINLELPASIDHAVENLTKPITTNIGQTFGDLWYLVFGGISQAAQKQQLKYATDLQVFKEEVEAKINEIPNSNRTEPNLQIVAPALENSKYCVESKELRFMFANLISRSMNIDYSQYIHPSFADILKRMSPLDAQNLFLFMQEEIYPICDIHQKTDSNNAFTVLFQNLFIANKEVNDFNLQAQSISSLIHLGLIEIPPFTTLSDETMYDAFFTNELYTSLKNSNSSTNIEITLHKKEVELTALGKAFIAACL